MECRDSLIRRLQHEREELRFARETSNAYLAREWSKAVARTVEELEAFDARPDTAEESEDLQLGFVRSQQQELENIERLLRDDRPEGERVLKRWLLKMSKIEEVKERKAS